MRGYDLNDEQRRELRTTGKLTKTADQLDADFADDFVRMAFDYGLQYYGMARFGLAAHFMPVALTVLHHAVEMFLQGCLALKDSPAQIRKYYQTYYSHKLPKLWADFAPRYPNAGLAEFDNSIVALEKFREIRFPENLAQRGGMMSAGFGEVPPQSQPRDRDFTLDARLIDKLVVRLFEIAELNPPFFNYLLKSEHAEPYFAFRNEHPLIR
jgi:hypothetical protein